MGRLQSFGGSRRTSAQKAHWDSIRVKNNSNKENILILKAPGRPRKATSILSSPMKPKGQDQGKKLKTVQRARKKIKELHSTVESIHKEYKIEISARKLEIANLQVQNTVLQRQKAELEARIKDLFTDKSHYQVYQKSLKKQVKHITQSVEKVERKLSKWKQQRSQMTRKGVYNGHARDLARRLFYAGCAPDKIGTLLQQVSAAFGMTISKTMSARTVRRCVLEAMVASNVQMGYGISKNDSLTFSQDSMSNRNINYQAHHIALKAPDYRSGETDLNPASQHAVRLLRIASTVDHSSEEAAKSWLNLIQDVQAVYQSSPLAKNSSRTLSLRDVALKLKGMNTDHTTTEKATADALKGWKESETMKSLGEDRQEVIMLLQERRRDLIASLGGESEWVRLDPSLRASHEAQLMESLKEEVGRDVYSSLSADQKRSLDMFFWAGYCMHKDQNSFKGGASEMEKAWELHGLTPPILLANKFHADKVQDALDPSRAGKPLSNDEAAAIEASTRGGVKLTALAGAIFNNKDDKKGYGDTHLNHLERELGRGKTCRFPDTSNVRFTTYGAAAAELLKHREFYSNFLVESKYRKQRPGWTNIEKNVYNGLQDLPTLTELAVMTLYAQAVTHPYMRLVRGPGTEKTNVLDLGPLHVQVRDHCQAIMDNPDLLISEMASFKTGSLDGMEWEDGEAMAAVRLLQQSGKVPHLEPMLIAFFRGAQTTWIRFSAEFAPGGLIDESSASEQELAWMPSTNDTNEGALGAYRVYMRNKPSTTLLSYNSQAVVQRNDTLAFMDSIFSEKDHQYIRKVARKLDASGLERKRKEALAAFEKRMAEMKRVKAEAAQRRLLERQIHLSNVKILQLHDIPGLPKLTVTILNEQLNALQEHFGDENVPKRSHRGLKAEKVKYLTEALKRHYSLPHTGQTPVTAQGSTLDTVEEGFNLCLDEIKLEMEEGNESEFQ